MKKLEELKQNIRLSIEGKFSISGDMPEIYHGRVRLSDGFTGTVVFGYDEGNMWEHVSFCPTHKTKLPTWTQMCELKDIFFKSDETVVQIHPAENEYLHGVGGYADRRENILHLWRPSNDDWSVLNHP